MLEDIFVRLSLIIIVAVGVSAVMKILKQPLIIGHIITGIIVGPYFFDLLRTNESVGTFSKLGVALLLFTVGLHLNPKVIKEVGKVSLVTGVGQVIFTSVIGYLIGIGLGFSFITSIYLSIAMTFSSTIIIMKLLTDKGDIDTVYGKIAIGFLIVQDLIAVLIHVTVSSMSGHNGVLSVFTRTLFNEVIVIGFFFLVSFYLLNPLMKFIAKSQEFLLLFSIGWALALASIFQMLNLSMEIGALFAGVFLSMSPYTNEITSKMKPLRDFFIVMFFIVIGSQMIFTDVQNNIVPIIVFSLFILIGNPLIVMVLMGLLGYTKRNSFLAGLTVAQISEFSIILIALGISIGQLTSEALSIITTVGLITIAGSTYMIFYSEKIYNKFSGVLNIFERKKVREKKKMRKDVDAILFGYNRIGFSILRAFKKIKKSYLVVDFNPEIISSLSKYRIPCLYGDAYDMEFLEELPLRKIKLVVSTIPDVETNFLLIEKIRMVNKNAVIILRAHRIEDALMFYKKGADYVLTPHFLGGEYVAKMIEHLNVNAKDYKAEKEKHLKTLKEMAEGRKEHPDVERN
ncbi:MAG: cation:proton antiporter family protein [archaeon]